jgi:hypothetical protein
MRPARIAAAFLAVAVVAGVLVVLLSGGAAAPKPAERPGFETFYYLRQGESLATGTALHREMAAEQNEPQTKTAVEVGLEQVRCTPSPPAPLPSTRLICAITIGHHAAYAPHAKPFSIRHWHATVSVNPTTGALKLAGLRRAARSSERTPAGG